MRPLWLVCAGCGRLGFGATTEDAAPTPVDASEVDAAPDMGDPSLLLRFSLDAFANNATEDANGTIASCDPADCPTAIPGRHGNALRFGGNDELRIAYDARFEAPAEFTIAAWVYFEGFDGAIFSRYVSPDIWNTWQLEVVGGESAFTTSDGLGAHEKLLGPALPAMQWTHLAGVWTGTQKRFYVNGAEVASSPWTTLTAEPLPLVVGFDVNAGVDELHFTGGIDELRFYNRALDAAEVGELAQ